jgi:hypothetical protein
MGFPIALQGQNTPAGGATPREWPRSTPCPGGAKYISGGCNPS